MTSGGRGDLSAPRGFSELAVVLIWAGGQSHDRSDRALEASPELVSAAFFCLGLLHGL